MMEPRVSYQGGRPSRKVCALASVLAEALVFLRALALSGCFGDPPPADGEDIAMESGS